MLLFVLSLNNKYRMRKISATYIYPISSPPIKNGIITLDENNTILSVDKKKGDENVEYHEGIICPGFINTHCHLELSHLKGKIADKKGMATFITEVITKRNSFSEKEIQSAIESAEQEMLINGIVAVGDISNNSDSFSQKEKNNLYYHTFIEVLGLNPENAKMVLDNAKKTASEYSNKKRLSIVPHAPYSVSDSLFKRIRNDDFNTNKTICIHNQESLAETAFFANKTGDLVAQFSKMGIPIDAFQATGKSPLQSVFTKLSTEQKRLLVHNTFTTQADIDFVKHNNPTNTFWCTCPNANLYINQALPDYQLFLKNNLNVTIGTDSLASNWSLSVLDELKTIAKNEPSISTQTLLTWATKNGANALNFDHLGTLDIGKKPGLNLLKNTVGGLITPSTKVKVLA